MQITKELLDKDIENLTAQVNSLSQQIEQAKVALAQSSGALSVLQAMAAFIMQPYPTEADLTAISPENAAIQERDQARALSMKEVAELVAGPGATAEISLIFQDAEEEYLDASE